MTAITPMRLDPAGIVWSRFDGLEPPEPDWDGHHAFWEEFTRSFFHANGLAYDPASDSNVARWLSAPDRAPFAAMVAALLPRLAERERLDDADMVMLAHWLPDLHLGTSVTNFAMHRLGLTDCVGFAVSDRGLSAPLFALDCIARCLANRTRKALLLVMDQKHLLYRSAAVDALRPENAACAMVLEPGAGAGLRFLGYRRDTGSALPVPDRVAAMAAALGIAPSGATLVGPPDLLAELPAWPGLAADPRLVCTAPFAALAGLAGLEGAVLILTRDHATLTAVGLAATEHRPCV